MIHFSAGPSPLHLHQHQKGGHLFTLRLFISSSSVFCKSCGHSDILHDFKFLHSRFSFSRSFYSDVSTAETVRTMPRRDMHVSHVDVNNVQSRAKREGKTVCRRVLMLRWCFRRSSYSASRVESRRNKTARSTQEPSPSSLHAVRQCRHKSRLRWM